MAIEFLFPSIVLHLVAESNSTNDTFKSSRTIPILTSHRTKLSELFILIINKRNWQFAYIWHALHFLTHNTDESRAFPPTSSDSFYHLAQRFMQIFSHNKTFSIWQSILPHQFHLSQFRETTATTTIGIHSSISYFSGRRVEHSRKGFFPGQFLCNNSDRYNFDWFQQNYNDDVRTALDPRKLAIEWILFPILIGKLQCNMWTNSIESNCFRLDCISLRRKLHVVSNSGARESRVRYRMRTTKKIIYADRKRARNLEALEIVPVLVGQYF